MRVWPALILSLLWPGAAAAHQAFGDLGPFSDNMLHPLADPAQGMLLLALAVWLARQPVAVVRLAVLVLAVAALAAIVFGARMGLGPVSLRVSGALAAGLGIWAIIGRTAPAVLVPLVAAGAGLAAGLAFELDPASAGRVQEVAGGMAGIVLACILVWAPLNLLERRIGPVAVRVAASWIAAIGIMTAMLPDQVSAVSRAEIMAGTSGTAVM